jgi:hypothetical protein
MNTSFPASSPPAEGRDRSLWFAVIGAPFLYLLHHQLIYTLVPWACASRKHWVLPAVSAVFLLFLGGSGTVSWRELRRLPIAPDGAALHAPFDRHRFLATLGLMSAALFFLLVCAQGLATLILDPCPE